MLDHDHKKLFLQNCFQSGATGLTKRMVWEKSLPTGPGIAPKAVESPSEGEKIDYTSKDFDEKVLNNKEGKFDQTKKDQALKEAINQLTDKLEGLDEKAKTAVKEDLLTGLNESIGKSLPGGNLESISNILATQKCEKVKLVHNKATDTLEFKFFAAKNVEIVIKKPTVQIKFEYIYTLQNDKKAPKPIEKSPSQALTDQFKAAGVDIKILDDKAPNSPIKLSLPDLSRGDKKLTTYNEHDGKIELDPIHRMNFRKEGQFAPRFIYGAIIDNTVIEINGQKFAKAKLIDPTDKTDFTAWIPLNSYDTIVGSKKVEKAPTSTDKSPSTASAKPSDSSDKKTKAEDKTPEKKEKLISPFKEAFNTTEHSSKTTESLARIEKVFLNRETRLISKDTSNPLPAISPEESKFLKIKEASIYKINGEKYVKATYNNGAIIQEGWLKVADLVEEKTAKVEENKEEKAFLEKYKTANERREALHKGPNSTVKFPDADSRKNKTLQSIYGDFAKAGDSVNVQQYSWSKPEKATYDEVKKDFFLANGERAMIFEGSKFSALNASRQFDEKDEAPDEKIVTLGKIRIKNKPETIFYTDLAEKILDPKVNLEELKKSGINISDAKLLNDLRTTQIPVAEYAKLLEANRKGNSIYVVYSPDFNSFRLKKMETEAKDRKKAESEAQEKLDSETIKKAEKDMMEEKGWFKKLFGMSGDNPEDNQVLSDRKFKLDDKTIDQYNRFLRENKDTHWNKAWDSGQIKGKENLKQVWDRTFGRSEHELRDFTFKFFDRCNLFTSHGGVTLNDMLSVLADSAGITDEKGVAYDSKKLLSERVRAKNEFDQFEAANGNFVKEQVLKNGPEIQKYDFALKIYKENIAAGRPWGEGLDKKMPGDPRTYEQILLDPRMRGISLYAEHLKFEKIYTGCLLMLDSLTKVRFDTTGLTESKEATRALTGAEQALSSVFNMNDKGKHTMHDVAGDYGKDGETQSIRLLPWAKDIPILNLLSSQNLSPNHVKTTFERFASGESAFLRISDKCRDASNQLDPIKLKTELNRLAFLGAYSFRLMEPGSYTKYLDLSRLFRGKGDASYDEALKLAEAKPNETNLGEVAKKLYEKIQFTTVDGPLKLSDVQRTLIELGYVVDLSGAAGKMETKEKFYAKPEDIPETSDGRYLDFQGMQVGLGKEKIAELSNLAKTPAQRMMMAEFLRIYKTPDKAKTEFAKAEEIISKYAPETQEVIRQVSYKALQSYRNEAALKENFLKFLGTAADLVDRNMKAVEDQLAKKKIATPKAKDGVAVGVGIKLGENSGVGVGFAIPLGDSTAIAVGLGKYGDNWVAGVGVGKEWKITEGVKVEGGLGTGIPISDPTNIEKWSINLGVALKVKVGEVGNYDVNVIPAVGASASLKDGVSFGAGVGVSMEYNSERALASEVRDKLKTLRLAAIDKAVQSGNTAEAMELLIADPLLGKTILALRNEYNLSDEDAIKVYQDQREMIASSAAQDLHPFIMKASVGVGASVNTGSGDVTIGVGGTLVIGFAQIVKMYQFEKVTSKEALAGADQGIDQKTRKYISEKLPAGIQLNDQVVVFNEGKSIILTGAKGEKVIAQEKEKSLAEVRKKLLELGQIPTVEDYNKALAESGIKLTKAEQGLLKLSIPELENKVDPTYEKRDIKIYIDPKMQAKNKSALVFKDGNISLATDSQPNLFIRKVTYYTPYSGEEGATAHTVIVVTDLPSRSTDDIMKASRFYIGKAPGRTTQVVDTENGLFQDNLLNGNSDKYSTERTKFGVYEEPSADRLEKMENAMKERQKQFIELTPTIRSEIVPKDENDQKTDCFAKRFFEKNKLEFKKLTTAVKPGEDITAKLAALRNLVDKAAAADPKLRKTVPDGKLTDIEYNLLLADLTRRSWSDLRDKNPKEKQSAFQARIEMARTTLKPHWIEAGKKMTPPMDEKASLELLNSILDEMKMEDVDKSLTALDPDFATTTFAGSQGVEGLRPNTNVLKLRNLKRFESKISEDSREGRLARFILDSQSPIPKEDVKFVQSPLALRAFSKLALIEAFGPDAFKDITEYFKSGGTSHTDTVAVKDFKELIEKIRSNELAGLGGTFFNFQPTGGKEVLIKVSSLAVGAGLDERCSNFSTTVKEDFAVYAKTSEKPLAYGTAERTATSIGSADSVGNIGVGIGLAVSWTPKPQPPKIPPKGEPTKGSATSGTAQGAGDKTTAPKRSDGSETTTTLTPEEDTKGKPSAGAGGV